VNNLVCYARHTTEKILKATNKSELQCTLRTGSGKTSPTCLKIQSIPTNRLWYIMLIGL